MSEERSTNNRAVLFFFALVVLLTLPFWFASFAVHTRLMPGLPIAAFAVIVPLLSAVIVAWSIGRTASVRELFASLTQKDRHKLVIGAIAIGLPVGVAFLSWVSAEAPHGDLPATTTLLTLLPVFLIAALAEEIGWSAFATKRLLTTNSVMGAGLIVGVIWAVWHVPSLIELGRSAEWIGWWSLRTIAQRLIMTALYVRAVYWLWAPVLFHAASNLAWQAAPDAFDPRLEGIAMAAIALGFLVAFREPQAR